MNTSTRHDGRVRPIPTKLALAIAVSMVTFALGAGPAFGDDHDNHNRAVENHGHDKVVVRRDYRAHGHRAPQQAYRYEAPPVYYAPRPSPGIRIFVPIDLR